MDTERSEVTLSDSETDTDDYILRESIDKEVSPLNAVTYGQLVEKKRKENAKNE